MRTPGPAGTGAGTGAGTAARRDGVARRVAALRASPRCGARTRAGTPCRAPALAGKRRCRMHGGARGSGARPGNRNARKHGYRSRAARAERRRLRALIRTMELTLARVGG